MRQAIVAFWLGALIAVANAAPPEAPKELKTQPGQLLRVTVKGDKIGYGKTFKDEDAFFDELVSKDKERRFVFQATKPGVYTLGFVTIGEGDVVFTTITVGDPEPAPKPKPKPDAPDDKQDPTKSFRVIFVYESGDLLTSEQRAVVYGKAVEDYLNATCTGGKTGWRRRDKDAPGDDDPTMAELWAAVKAKVTVTPCVAIERNGKVDIVNTESTPNKMIDVFKTYARK